jgi:ribose transport system substrate-binding protein
MKRIISLILALIIMAALAVCVSAAVGTEDRSNQLYIHVTMYSNQPYMYDHLIGTELAGKELGVKTEYIGPAEYDINGMIAAFEQAIAKKPDGIIVSGFETTLGTTIDKATEAGIPCVTVDGDVPNSKRIAFVGTGNYEAGRQVGQLLSDNIDGKGKVALMLKVGQWNLEERLRGCQEVLANYPEIEVVQTADTQSDAIVAAQAATALLQKYPDLAAIASVEESGGMGAATAVKEADKVGQVKIITMDRSESIVNGIEDGIITASVAQQTALMPYYAVQILYNLRNSNPPITTDNKAAGVTPAPIMIDTGTVIVDANNAKYFKREN